MMIRRRTIQKDLVLDAVKELKSHVSADEVYEYLLAKCPTISRGTVYRNLNILSEENRIKKVKTSDGADIFDHVLSDHYHVKCKSCGTISDVDMEVLPDLIPNIAHKHGFEFLGYSIFFEGLCPECRKEELAI